MAKIYGLFGAMTGKVADVVMVVRNGAQIARKYQPVVSNPSTPAQVGARARLKLMSQLAAVVSFGLGFRREGLVSARNLFVRANYPASSYNNGQASINMAALDLSGGVLSLPAVQTPLRASNNLEFSLVQSPVGLDGVIYAIIETGLDNHFAFVRRLEVEEAGDDGHYGGSISDVPSNVGGYIYAYGYRFTSETARARYQDIIASGAQGVLDVILASDPADVELTRTAGVAFTAVN